MTAFRKSFGGSNRCRRCGKNHVGQCRAPVRCYHCGQSGHFRSDCPQLRRATATAPSPPARMDIQRRDPSRLPSSESGLEEVEPILELEEENQRGYDDEFEKEERKKEEDKYLFEESKEQNVVVEGLEFNYSSSDDSTNDESEDNQVD
ncbi:PREDICTED: U11/U12 small nuclear ribonucleoprotein 31 kDa protein [Theobroma cacao]|uniref:U11/U12 small nuclear ribonucleoprotein 31 kDa protein n=1 Tax=Theobroma cacao TaxID=3641 RepID=A0AB32WCK2_THECC|nr:PREDICTED: U11/U12 small nuclear ribonucleoprotein 31 kDa protein [Theobroma cacao]